MRLKNYLYSDSNKVYLVIFLLTNITFTAMISTRHNDDAEEFGHLAVIKRFRHPLYYTQKHRIPILISTIVGNCSLMVADNWLM